MKYIILGCWFVISVTANPITSSLTCEEPSPIEIAGLFSDAYLMHESFDMTRYNSVHLTHDMKNFENITTTRIPGYSTACRRYSNSYNINAASSCPWHYVLNVDPNRIPGSIIEAKCNCRNRPCVNGGGNSQCEPLKYNIRVLRKYGCENGKFLYKRTSERITVGCTCVTTQ
jgi:hypothetical protein